MDPAGVRGPPPDGLLHGPHLPAPLRRAGAARGRSAGVAGDVVVRRPHGVQDGGGEPGGGGERRHLLGVGSLRLPLDHAVPQHRRDAHGVGQRPSGDAPLRPPGAAGWISATARVRGANHVPEPLGRRLVDGQRHRRAAESRVPGHAGHRGAEPRDGAPERLPEGRAADGARPAGRDQGVRDPGRAARSPDHASRRSEACRARSRRS